jgi:hypothetical protein
MDKEISTPLKMEELEAKHESKGRSELFKSIRKLKDSLKSDLVLTKVTDTESNLYEPSFHILLRGVLGKVRTGLESIITSMNKLGYVSGAIKVDKFGVECDLYLKDNTPISDGRVYKSVTHGDIRDIKNESGSKSFNAEVAVALISQMIDSRSTASQELRYLLNGNHEFDFGQSEMSSTERSMFQSAMYQFYKLLERKGF